MGKLLQTLTLAGLTCYALLTAPIAKAQDADAPGKKSDKLGEYDEIIIKRKTNQDGKVTVEIKDGEVWVDGKKLEEYKDGDLTVYRRKIRPMDGNALSFNGPRGGMSFFNNDDDDNDGGMVIGGSKALLGVLSEKKEAAGVTIKQVSKDSPADKAGLKAGDVITAVDADKIAEPQDLFEKIGEHDPGDKVTITYLRDGKEHKATATLDERKDAGTFNFSPAPRGNGNDNFFRFAPPRGRQPYGGGNGFGWFNEGDNRDTRLGLSVQDTEDGKGARVLDVNEGSAAAKAGFKQDDIITSIGGEEVNSARDVVNSYRDNKDKGSITAKVKRNNKEQTLTITVPKKLNKADL
ncbi:PDZ domain-containing protein [Chitinophaga agrisoli]|uniref:PDZ domain-containing protein n=1 Tax=Chitinophaga agrisoli TaxID=2607653 RepID=A0A5B2W332_9BACT|nr:PDZ domain-containing protein [Chitinophaga agrisoli]KAA2244669.1 PDZ domain-containing protein [Chitinophaga agrisoli]